MPNLQIRNKVFLTKLREHTVSPIATDADGIHAAVTLLAAAQVVSTAIVQPDVPRVVTITGAKAGANLTGNVVIWGLDVDGNPVKDTIALNDNATVAGVKAFKYVQQINLPARVTVADTVEVGFNDAIGLPELIPGDTILAAIFNKVYETVRPTVHIGAAVADCYVDPNSALDGSSLILVYIAK
jgi:hypothetical protein